MFDIRDREVRNIRREKETGSVPFGEEIIITSQEIDDLSAKIDGLNT
jgi:hypothetical protein